MNGVQFPSSWKIEVLNKSHHRRVFGSGSEAVDDWFRQLALQSQAKHLTTTKVLLNDYGFIVGYYTLATSQVDFSELPFDLAKSLPRRQLPVAVLAWLGTEKSCQGQGMGKRLLAAALSDCYVAWQTFAFVAVILDCVDQAAKEFYQRFDFEPLPGYPMRFFLSFKQLDKLMKS